MQDEVRYSMKAKPCSGGAQGVLSGNDASSSGMKRESGHDRLWWNVVRRLMRLNDKLSRYLRSASYPPAVAASLASWRAFALSMPT